jgi:M6 family metalloprotease-like protein
MERNTTLTLLAVAAMCVSVAQYALAIPARPRPITLTQPDGSQFTAVLKGDEHFHFAEDQDGYSIILDKDGWWTYAKPENGLLAASGILAGKGKCPYPKHLRPNAEAIAGLSQNKNRIINISIETRHQWSVEMLYGAGGTKGHPSKAATGRQYINILLGDYTDSSFAWYSSMQKAGNNPSYFAPFPYDAGAANGHNLANAAYFNFLAFGDSVSPYVPDSSRVGTLTNYFFDVSYRKCWCSGIVDGPRSSGLTRTSAASSYYPSYAYINAVLANADPYVNYDQNSDGTADITIIIHPGHGSEETSDGNDIWSGPLTGSFGTYDGVTITKLVFLPQNMQLGALAHETFNLLGAPDLYDYGCYSNTWGVWSLMDMGCWAGSPVSGSQPTFPGGHLVYDIDGNLTNGIDGWLTDGALGNTDSISSLYRGDGQYPVLTLDSAGTARCSGIITGGIRLWRLRNANFLDSGQVFFVENRRRNPPYESGLPEDGLIITHIDTRMVAGTRLNDGPPCARAYYSWVERPGFDINQLYSVGDTSNYYCGECDAAYSADDINGYYNTAHNSIDSTTIPNSWINQCYGTTPAQTGPFIVNIGVNAPCMTFDVIRTGLSNGQPLLSYSYCTIKDPPPANHNGLLDAWETDTVVVTVRNNGVEIIAGAACSLYTEGVSYATVVNPGWRAINGGSLPAESQGQSGGFLVAVSRDIPMFSLISFGLKVRSTIPAFNDELHFTCLVSPMMVNKVYDFSKITVGGSTDDYSIRPSDCAIYGDTLIVANANLLNSTPQTRIYKVKKSTANNPLAAADTFGSLNNAVITNKTNYICGMDVDNAGTLWYTMEDTVWHTNRGTTLIQKFEGANAEWLGTNSLKRMRGLAFGPAAVDTVGEDMIPGDSLLLYWQYYLGDGAVYYNVSDSIFNYKKVTSGTTAIARRWALSDSGWNGVSNFGYGWSAWDGRGLENDGMNLWTTSSGTGLFIQRNPVGRIIRAFPGPPWLLGDAIYGLTHEVTDSNGTVYAPEGGAGSKPYVPYAKGTKHYMYMSSFDSPKIYKVDISNMVLPTVPDSVQLIGTLDDLNILIIYKSDADWQKVSKYIIYRRYDNLMPTSADSIGVVFTGRRADGRVAVVDTFYDYYAMKGKAYGYSVRSVNYSGYGTWLSTSPTFLELLAVEFGNFSYSVDGYDVELKWNTVSETGSKSFEIMRSKDEMNCQTVGEVKATGNSSTGGNYIFHDVVPEAGKYDYTIYEICLDGRRNLIFKQQISVEQKAPDRFELARIYPNPLIKGNVNLRFSLPNSGQVSLKVYNILGQEVKTIVNDYCRSGIFDYKWDGCDNSGITVAQGIYVCKLEKDSETITRKIVVLK